jgi:enoyl-CoA hydratase/carnithine racemase
MSDPGRIEVTRDGGVVVVTIDRPARRNALPGPLWQELAAAFRALAGDAPRVVILTGRGGHFCAGMDLSFDNPLLVAIAQSVQAKDEAAVQATIRDLKAVMEAVRSVPCPVVAAIDGACLGGGLELALACDLRVAGDDARFSLPEARWGMVPDVGGTTRLCHLVGRARAADLILTGRTIDADAAASWGLVDRRCAAGGALEAARGVAAEIRRSAPIATKEALGVLRGIASAEDAAGFALETAAGARAVCAGEVMEGVMAFVSRRDPSWVSG